jgi:hypothetical protein
MTDPQPKVHLKAIVNGCLGAWSGEQSKTKSTGQSAAQSKIKPEAHFIRATGSAVEIEAQTMSQPNNAIANRTTMVV